MKIIGNDGRIILTDSSKAEFIKQEANLVTVKVKGETYKAKVYGSNASEVVYKVIDSEVGPGPGPEPEYDLIIDGLGYRTVEMPDGRIWMAENLQAAEGNAMFYDNDEATYGRNGKNYGRLYTWNEALAAAEKVSGWHIPTATEWRTLTDLLDPEDAGMYDAWEAGTKLKSTTDWIEGAGTDDFGFSILPNGSCDGTSFGNKGSYAYLWSKYPSNNDKYYVVFDTTAQVQQDYYYSERIIPHMGVRLIKDI